jgi:pimeloyl-ACP methyl ester carboxylesterase
LGGDHPVISFDLRGHGASQHEPPWNTETQVGDLLETIESLSIDRALWIGHSFGARLAAALAVRAPDDVEGLILLDPALEIPPPYALASAEIERRDWTFESVDSAVNALMSARSTVDVPRETVAAFAAGDLVRAPDGRLRFSHSPAAVVAMWGEMALPPPPIADVPTLIVRPAASHIDGRPQDGRYRQELGSLLTITAVPKGHNVLWESPAETAAAIDSFLVTLDRT